MIQRSLPPRLEINFFAVSRPPTSAITSNEFVELIVGSSLESPDVLDRIAKSLDSTLDPKKAGFTKCRMIVDGTSERIDVMHNNQTRVSISHEGKQVRLRPENNQAHIFQRGQSPVQQKTVDDFIYVPAVKNWDDYEISLTENGRTKISKSSDQGSHVIVLAETGGAIELDKRETIRGENSISKIAIQGPGLPDIDFFFPEYRADATFLNGQLSDFRIYVTTSLVNEYAASKNDFTAQVPKGTLVINHTKDVNNPATAVLNQNTDDLVLSLPDIPDPSMDVTQQSTGRLAVLLAGGTVLLVALLVVARRRQD